MTTNLPLKLQKNFRRPPDDSRPMMRWWWFGPAVTKAGLAREMRLMKKGGIGGFEVQPVYPLAPDDEVKGIRNLRYLSEEFLDVLRFTSEKARELGLRMDLTLGSGWPYGGPQIPVNQAASCLRWERIKVIDGSRRVPLPSLATGEALMAVFAPDSPKELTDIRDGFLRLPGNAEQFREVWFFIHSRTGQMVKRAAFGAEGFVLDHYDRAAVNNFLKQVAEPTLQAIRPNLPYAVFCDSLEVFRSDWTGDFLKEFRRRRGYDLRPRLPALVAEHDPETAAIRHDWGLTLTELLEERFIAPIRKWAGTHRTRFRLQAYGSPPAAISSNAHADLNEGEGSQWKQLSASRWASSAGHLYGRKVISSETWTWLHSPVFRATPLDMKAEADLHFLQGINQLIGHGWPYTPGGVEYPGWRLYAAAVFNEKNPWWIVMPDISRYLQRLSFLLRQGQPVNDIAFYLPNSDAWAHMTPGRVDLFRRLITRLGPTLVARVLEAGYGFDFFDDRVLKQGGRIEKGMLVMGENRYRIVLLPGVETIPAATLRKLEEFVHSGGILVATSRLPDTAPGLMASEADKAEVHETIQRLFKSPSVPACFVADEIQLGKALNIRLTPDLSFSPAAPDIGFVHRSTGSEEIYFLANTGNRPCNTHAAFRIKDMEPDWWDPMTGNVQSAAVEGLGHGQVTVALNLAPYESRVLVFSRHARQPPPASDAVMLNLSAIDLSTDWLITFGAKTPAVRMKRLRSWTEDESTRYYSGLATYDRTFTVPHSFIRRGIRVRLDFGEGQPASTPPDRQANGTLAQLDAPVREAAVVTVNGHRAGVVWCPPYVLDITDFLRGGKNRLRIVVGNLALNHLAGQPLPDYKLLNLRYGERFQPQDMDKVQPVPSGLLGPIRLILTKNAQSN